MCFVKKEVLFDDGKDWLEFEKVGYAFVHIVDYDIELGCGENGVDVQVNDDYEYSVVEIVNALRLEKEFANIKPMSKRYIRKVYKLLKDAKNRNALYLHLASQYEG